MAESGPGQSLLITVGSKGVKGVGRWRREWDGRWGEGGGGNGGDVRSVPRGAGEEGEGPCVAVGGGGGNGGGTLGATWGRRRRERGPCTAVGRVGRPAAAPDQWARAVALLHEQGRMAGRGDSARERLIGGAGQQRGPVAAAGCGGERERASAARGADTWARPAQCRGMV
jgi:hypothetical protein